MLLGTLGAALLENMLSSLAEKGVIRAGDGVMILYRHTIYHFHPLTNFEA